MGGLLILVLAGLYLWIAYKVVRRAPPVWGKVLAIVVIVLIPTADAVYGRMKLRQICAVEGGLKIYKTVEGVEGFYLNDMPLHQEWITKYGYKFVEGKGLDGSSTRLGWGKDGNVVEEKNVTLFSRYQYEYYANEYGLGFKRVEHQVKDSETNQILARNLNFTFEGGWAERFIASLYAAKGFAGACQQGPALIVLPTFITNILNPVTGKK